MANCLSLSWKLLMYARETLLVASDNIPESVCQNQYSVCGFRTSLLTSKRALATPCVAGIESPRTGVQSRQGIPILSP